MLNNICSAKKKAVPTKNIFLFQLIRRKSPIIPQINAVYINGSFGTIIATKIISSNSGKHLKILRYNSLLKQKKKSIPLNTKKRLEKNAVIDYIISIYTYAYENCFLL